MTIGMLGCGNMGGAIASALVQEGKDTVLAFDHTRAKVEGSGAGYATLEELLSRSDLVVIAIKPQGIPALYPTLRQASPSEGWISIAAGITLGTLKEQLGTRKVVRFMPNIAAKVKKSVTAVCADTDCPSSLKEKAFSIATSFGSACSLDESLLPAFTGISGSGIAYVFQFMHAMALGGTRMGIPYPKSVEVVRDTMESAIALARATGKNPIDLMMEVCSAGGTTIEGVAALERNQFDNAVIEAVTDSANKSKKM